MNVLTTLLITLLFVSAATTTWALWRLRRVTHALHAVEQRELALVETLRKTRDGLTRIAARGVGPGTLP